MSKAALKAPLIGSPATTAASSDPFDVLKDKVSSQVSKLRSDYDSWKDKLSSVNTASDLDFARRTDDLSKQLSKAEEVCRKLRQTVTMVESDRAKYAHVHDTELQRRKAAIESLERDISIVRDGFNSKNVKAKLEGDQKRELTSRAVDDAKASYQTYNAYSASNSEFLRDQSSMQTQLRREQDVAVDQLSGSLSRVKELAVAIDVELREQDALMTDIDSEMVTAQSKMDQAIHYVEKLLKTKDRCQLCTIAILVIAFIVVAIIAFYTLTG